MAHKQLTAKVKLDVSQAEQAINRLSTKIKNINNAFNSISNRNNSGFEAQMNRSASATKRATAALTEYDRAAQRLAANKAKSERTAYQQWWAEQLTTRELLEQERVRQQNLNTITQTDRAAEQLRRTEYENWWAAQLTLKEWEKAHPVLTKVANKIGVAKSETMQWGNSINTIVSALNSKLKGTHGILGGLISKLKYLASVYLGVMGTKALIQTSDTITKAENKLNYVNAQQLGSGGMNTDGTYSAATFKATQDAMDKMYNSSQKVRMLYTDMMSNVSKFMTLSGGAFGNNVDNAIRFQEIMAEAYAIGGASAQEMSSSMYQLTQALGAGVLAGDELRSVREGAPLAYKAIEEFAQGVYNTEESLKELGSQGKITSDMVVAAVMNAGNQLDASFAQTAVTFDQVWTQIKNTATKAFEPVAHMLRDMLNRAVDNGLLEKIEVIFVNVSKVLQILFTLIYNGVTWIAENWNWLQHIVVGALMTMIALTIIKAGISVWAAWMEFKAWMTANGVLWAHIFALLKLIAVVAVIIIAILALVYVFYLWKTAAIDTCTAIIAALMIVGLAVLLIGILIGSIPMMIIGAVLIMLAVIFMFFEEVCYGAGWLAAWIVNIVFGIVNVIMAVVMAIATVVQWVIAFIVNLAMGCWNSLCAIADNIGIAFSNAWIWAKNTFWEFIADVLRGVSKLEPVINGIAGLLGKKGVNFGSLISAAESKKGTYQSYKSVGDAWSSGWNTMKFANMGDMVSAGWNTLDFVDANKWGSAAGDWGAGVKNKVNAWGSKFQNTNESSSLLDSLGEKLGLDFGNTLGSDAPLATSGNFDPNSLQNALGDALGGGGTGGLGKGVKDIADNTGSIADSMDLTEDDLEYLRKIADMEWKKEYTTASITVDMSNYNTINGDSDLDGIVTRLADKLYEEMNVVANGVYA